MGKKDRGDMMQPNVEAKTILDAIKYATLATVSSDGDPWNSPVYYVADENYNLYWASYTESQHSKNIRTNGKVFIAVYDSTVPWGTGTGVFIQAKAWEVTDDQEIVKACQLRQARVAQAKQPPEDFMGDKPRRIYCATPQHIWMNQDSEINGNFVDVRKEATE
jgi:nitroimidazol reductase NimA-like FMN-containing flavoprotein (pyridoxamine 5'-phosphate oxidase superfamily)